MALATELETLVKELEKVDPAAAKAQRELLEKHESLAKFTREHAMRQSDYDRFMNENKKKVDGYDQTISDWDKNYKIHTQLLKDHATLQDKATKLEADLQLKIAAAAATNNSDPDNKAIDPVKLADAVRERIKGDYVSQADIARIVAEESKKQMGDARTEFFDKTFPQAANWITSMVDAQFAHQREFGSPLPKAEFAKFLKDNGIADPDKGYEEFVKDKRTEKKISDEVTKRVDEEKKKLNGSPEFPGSSGPPQPLGALQIRLSKREEGDPLIPKDAELGDGTLAMAAAAELRKGA